MRRSSPVFELEAIGELSIREHPSPVLSADTLQRVDELWKQSLEDRALSNDRIFSLSDRQGSVLSGWFAEYRCWVAQMRDPELFGALGLRPLAVTGVVRVPGGIVLGRRSRATLQDAGLWELAPSGGITPRARRPEGGIAADAQLLIELEEELGVPPGLVESVSPVAMIEDRHTRVCDLVYTIRLQTPFEDVQEAFRAKGSHEYDEVRLVEAGGLEGFVSREAGSISPMSLHTLERIVP